MMRAPFFVLLVVATSLAGCSDSDEGDKALNVHVVNRTDIPLYEFFAKAGEPPGTHHMRLPAGESSSSNLGCEEDLREDGWLLNVTLKTIPHEEYFGSAEMMVACDDYSFWVHPSGKVYAEQGRPFHYESGEAVFRSAPWER